MKKEIGHVAGIIFAFLSFRSDAAVFYVNNSNPTPVSPYASWATAATDIQSAINAATDGDMVLVTNGVYRTGASSGSRISASKVLVVQSVNGPSATIIQGQNTPPTGLLRCASLAAKATLSGFTLAGGYTAGLGGGVFCGSVSSIVTNCIINGNISAESGGGGSLGSYYNCIIINNTANNGGGGGVDSGGVFNNCVIAGNICTQSGGGVNLPLAMTNCTVVGNSSGSATGSGVEAGVLGKNASIIRNCIIYYNKSSAANTVNVSASTAASISNCCIPDFFNQSCITNQPGIGYFPGGQDFHLSPESPCINAGDNGSVPDVADLDGNPRIFGGTIDIGAYESSFTGTVHFVSLGNTNPIPPYVDWSTAATNIQDAIDIANDGEYVIVGNGIYKTGGRVVYGSLTNRVVINKAVTVQSLNGPSWTIIQGIQATGNNAVRCVYLTNQAALVGITLSNGATRIAGDVFQEKSGAGAWCESANAFMTNCVISHCHAIYGGGIFSGTVANSAIINCLCNTSGGGTYDSILVNCLISNNVASSLGGGAIGGTLISCVISTNHALYGAGACSNMLLNCTLLNNLAKRTGGGTYACAVTNCFLSANNATNGGGSIYGSLNNCTLSGNLAANGGGTFSNSLMNCLINNNGASGDGGGAYASDLTGCTLQGNGAGNYGGASFYGNLTNCFIWQNSASTGGGGAAGGVCISCTITSNFAGSVGGGGVISNISYNCMLSSNRGGGSYYSTLNRCWFYLNNGGGSHYDVLNNCVVYGNIMGPGALGSTLNNCTVRNNGFPGSYYGVQSCNVTNSIVYSNFFGNYSGGSMSYCCTTPLPTGAGNFTNAPLFLDTIHLATNSPCINAGNTALAPDTVDYDGRPRVAGGAVDVGATEFQGATLEPFIVWLSQYFLPNDGSADYADADGDGMNNWQEWLAKVNPTNSQSVLKMFSPPRSIIQPATWSTGRA